MAPSKVVRRSNRLRDAIYPYMPSEVILTIENLSLQLGSKVIFSQLNLGVHSGDKIGIVGINGSGKSTLLRLIAGNLEPTTGRL